MKSKVNSTSGLLAAFYRCPDLDVHFEVVSSTCAEAGFFSNDDGVTMYGRLAGSQPASVAGGSLPRISADIRDKNIHLPFDPVEVIDNLRLERYRRPSVSGQSVSRQIYYSVRPFLPVGVRKHLQRASLRGWDQIPFPCWPVDRSADQVHEWLLHLSMRALGLEEVPFIWFWPDGYSHCATITHDVETAAGRDFCVELMAINDDYGIKSSFQVVPEERYSVSADFLESIPQNGFEVNVHDLNHDGQLFHAGYQRFRDRADKIESYGKQFGARGFRSAVLYRNADWLKELDFAYDMSIPNVAHLDPQRGGCCTLMPYFIGDLVEIPVTTTQDYSLFHILNDYSITLWKQQLRICQEAHGMASFIVHPDYVIDDHARKTYEKLLHELSEARAKQYLWIARPGEINDWWRIRSAMRIVRSEGGWTIVGEGSDRARIAYAYLDGDKIGYRVENSIPSHALVARN